MKIGVLAVQGDFEAHSKVLDRLGVPHVEVRAPGDLAGIDALILPGGESTTQWKFLAEEGLADAIRQFAHDGGALFGTCAGAILLAREVKNPPQDSLGLADLSVKRNAYGRQLVSRVVSAGSKLQAEPVEMVFIRAPVIDRCGPGVEVLAEWEGCPVLVREGRVLVATFHPELTASTAVHEYFLKMARNGA